MPSSDGVAAGERKRLSAHLPAASTSMVGCKKARPNTGDAGADKMSTQDRMVALSAESMHPGHSQQANCLAESSGQGIVRITKNSCRFGPHDENMKTLPPHLVGCLQSDVLWDLGSYDRAWDAFRRAQAGLPDFYSEAMRKHYATPLPPPPAAKSPNDARKYIWRTYHRLVSQFLHAEGLPDAVAVQAVAHAAGAIQHDFLGLHLLLGVVALACRHCDEAIAAFTKTLQCRPSFTLAHQLRAQSFYQKRDYAQGLHDLEQARQGGENRSSTERLYGQILCHFGRYTLAKSILQNASRKAPDDPIAWIWLGHVAFVQGDYAQALATAQHALDLNATRPEGYLVCGYCLAAQQRYEEALKNFDAAILLRLNYLDAHLAKATACLATHQPEQARRSCQDALRLQPTCAKAHALHGHIMWTLGDHAQSIEAFDHALRYNAGLMGVYISRASLLYECGRSQAALRSYTQAFVHNMESTFTTLLFSPSPVNIKAVQNLVYQGLRMAIVQRPQSASMQNYWAATLQGCIRANDRRYAEALAAYKQAVSYNPHHYAAHGLAAFAFVAQKRFDAGAQHFDKAIACAPRFARLFIGKAQCFMAAEQPAAAIRVIEQALQLTPSCPRALAMRGRALLALKHYAVAQAACTQALQQLPRNAELTHLYNEARQKQIVDAKQAP